MQVEELQAWLRLLLTPGVGSHGARRLLTAFGSAESIFIQPAPALRAVASAAQVMALQRPPATLAPQLELAQIWMQEAGDGITRRIVSLADSDYPPALLQIPDPPILLYLMHGTGRPPAPEISDPIPWPERAIAVVGSRNPTAQGQLNARHFSHALCAAGWTVVSGLALGVDTAAHIGALETADHDQARCWPPTIAVIGTGIDRVYPTRNQALAHQIAHDGMVISEFPMGTGPLGGNFPRRNRLISGLSRGTLVVEAAPRSGSLVTARLATEQGREVFAIPGSIHSPLSRGPHTLIRDGAKLVETARDILEELGDAGVEVTHAADGTDPTIPSSPEGEAVLQVLGGDPVGLDALQARTGLATAELQARLLELELAGHVARLPGGLFQRIGSA